MAQIDDATLVAFVDGELDDAAMRRIAEAISRDPEAHEKVRLLRQSAALVRAVFREPRFERVSPEVTAALAGPPPGWASRLRQWRIAVPLAASLVAAMLFAGGYVVGEFRAQQPADFSAELLDEVAQYHIFYATEGEHQVEVPATRLHDIEQWIGQQLHRTLSVPDLSGHGFVFEGARMLAVDGQPVAQLLYQRPAERDRPFGVCITFGAPGEEALRTDRREGVSLALWRRAGYTYVLVGWVDAPFLATVAAELAPKLGAS